MLTDEERVALIREIPTDFPCLNDPLCKDATNPADRSESLAHHFDCPTLEVWVVVRRLLASDWLAAHDAQVRREERERIAQAIEALEEQSKTHSAGQWSKDDTVTRHGLTYAYAARIARGETGSSS